MPTTKHSLNADKGARLRLSEIHRLIKVHKIMVPPPSRATLAKLCESGTFETVGNAPTTFGWLVYENSFWKWVEALGEQRP
ncbi:MAG: hypothetical protein LC730_04845 [Acidobacteria bacterium]|nr:hypothetical protein [Acidobacteriota bacterium]MCA1608772.1 hypothetical protein [Acidobacteriota bacterium]